jgi:hypothetical protein
VTATKENAVEIAPNWHGATPDHFMTHLSITEGDAEWGAHVTDTEYAGDQ